MTVIINDFEITVEPSPATGDAQARGSQQGNPAVSPAPLRPEDIECIVRHFEQRRERVMAD